VSDEPLLDLHGRVRPEPCPHGREPIQVAVNQAGDFEWRVGAESPRAEEVQFPESRDDAVCPECWDDEVEAQSTPDDQQDEEDVEVPAQTDDEEGVAEPDFEEPTEKRCPHGVVMESRPTPADDWQETGLECPSCEAEVEARVASFERKQAAALESVHVEMGEAAYLTPATFIDVSDVVPNEPAWDAVSGLVMADPEAKLSLIEVLEEGQRVQRLKRLASISIAESNRRFARTGVTPLPVTDALMTCYRAFASHLAHLENVSREPSLYFARWGGGGYRRLNHSVLLIGRSGSFKGVTLQWFAQSVRHSVGGNRESVLVPQPDGSVAAMLVYFGIGRASIQGILGTFVRDPKTGEWEFHPGAFPLARNGVLLVDEAKTLLNPQGADESAFNNLLELLTRGETEVTLGSAKGTIASWSMFIGGLTPDAWRGAENAVHEGLPRRILPHSMPELPPALIAQYEREAARDVPLDKDRLLVMRAQWRLMEQALKSVTEIDFDSPSGSIVQWVAQAKEIRRIPPGQEEPFYTAALGDALVETTDFSTVKGKLEVLLTPGRQQVLEGYILHRRALHDDPEELGRVRVHEAVLDVMTPMRAAVKCELSAEVATMLQLGSTWVSKLLDKLVYEPPKGETVQESDVNPDAEYELPLRRVTSEEAYEWAKEHGQPLSEPKEFRASPRYILVRTQKEADELGRWQSARLANQSDKMRRGRVPAYAK